MGLLGTLRTKLRFGLGESQPPENQNTSYWAETGPVTIEPLKEEIRPTEPKAAAALAKQRSKLRRAGSSAFPATLELLTATPEVSAAEVSEAIGVSVGYARTLLRRARSHANAPGAGSGEAARGTASIGVLQRGESETVQTELAELRRSLASTQQMLAQLSVAPVALRKTLALNRRAHILRLQQEGEAPEEIAAKLGIARGEVDFTLKIGRLIEARF